jgi:PAS domain-containing protein
MAVRPRVLSLRTLRTWPRLGGPASISATLALALFAGIFLLRMSDPDVTDGTEILFVLPIALLAIRFGLRGGLAGGLLAIVLTATWDIGDSGYMHAMLTTEDYLIGGVAFLLLGTLLGIFADERRRLQAEISLYYDESLDLLATIDRNGRFTRVNPVWERTLGHSAETMCSRPYIEFVHPMTARQPAPRRSSWPEASETLSGSATATAPRMGATDGWSGTQGLRTARV